MVTGAGSPRAACAGLQKATRRASIALLQPPYRMHTARRGPLAEGRYQAAFA